ncbi:MAG: gluconolactonase [Rhodospirillales bacterium]|nr:gluconolactonase [Rhodospirillales bacterium]
MSLRQCLLPVALILGLWSQAHAASPVDDLRIVAEIPGSDATFDFASVDPTARRLYIARGDGVMSVDLADMKVTPTFIPGAKVHAVLPLPDGRLLSTNGASDTATLSDSRTGMRIAEIPTGKHPDAAAYDQKTGLVFVMDADDSDATLIDPKTGTMVGHMPIGGTLESVVTDGAGRLYVTIEDKAEIAIIDTVHRKIVGHYPLPGCEEPSGLGLDPDEHILLAVCKNQHAVALHAENGKVAATLDIDRIPDAVIFDAARKMFFVPCARDATMFAIATNHGKPSVVRKIPTANGARAGALDPQSGKLYLPSADYTIGLTGFTQKAGTFRILVVGTRP